MKTINEVKDKAIKILGNISLKQLSNDKSIRDELYEIINSTNLNIEKVENQLNIIELFISVNNKIEDKDNNFSYLKNLASDLRKQKVRQNDLDKGIPLFKVEKEGKSYYFLTRKAAKEFIEINKDYNLEIIIIEETEDKRLKKIVEQIKQEL